MNYSRTKSNGFQKIPTALLASAIVLGGASALTAVPTVSAAESASVSSAAAQDAAREKLTHLVYASIKAESDFRTLSDDERLWELAEAKNKALTAIGDPSASASAVKSAESGLEKSLDAYIGSKVKNTDDTDFFLYRILRGMLSGQDKEDVILEPWEEVLYTTVIETRAVLNSGSGSEEQRGEAGYKHYVLSASKSNDLKAFEIGDYGVKLGQYRSDAQNGLAALEALGVDYGDRKQEFDRSAAYLEQLMNGSYSKTAYDVALNDAESYRNMIVEGVRLAERIQKANLLMDSPRGIQPGQYPASSFGKLNREINAAKRVLDKAWTADELHETDYLLSLHISEFQQTVKP